MKILGIGNAIVDVICKVEDKFITQNNLTKSTMKLVDETEFKKLFFSNDGENFSLNQQLTKKGANNCSLLVYKTLLNGGLVSPGCF